MRMKCRHLLKVCNLVLSLILSLLLLLLLLHWEDKETQDCVGRRLKATAALAMYVLTQSRQSQRTVLVGTVIGHSVIHPPSYYLQDGWAAPRSAQLLVSRCFPEPFSWLALAFSHCRAYLLAPQSQHKLIWIIYFRCCNTERLVGGQTLIMWPTCSQHCASLCFKLQRRWSDELRALWHRNNEC